MEMIISCVFFFYVTLVRDNLDCVLSEYASKGCLYDHLANNRLDFDQILRWSTEIARGKSVIISFSSPEAAILLVSTKNQDLWPVPIFEHAQKILFIIFRQSDLTMSQ